MGAVGWLAALGCMFIGAAVSVWGYTEFSRTVTIWIIGVPGAMCLVVGAALELQKFAPSTDKPKAKENTQRAYVLPDNSEVTNIAGSPVTAIVNIRNSGQTPAYELTWRVRFVVATVEYESKIQIERDTPASSQTLPPGNYLSYTYTFPEWDSTFDDLLSEEKGGIYCVGEIRYKDIDGQPHSVDYLLRSGGRFGVKTGTSPGRFSTVHIKSD